MEGYLESYRSKRVVITGGLGFIGSNLAWALATLGARQIAILDSMMPGSGANIHNIKGLEGKVEVTIGDLRDAELTRRVVEGTDVIFNLVGQVSHIDSICDPLKDLEANCRAHLVLLEACREINPTVSIVYTGTRQIYGRPRYLPLDEEHPIEPIDINGVNKLAAERYHLIYGRVHGMPIISLRLTNTYGPRQLIRHKRQGFVGWFIKQALLGEEILIYGDGQQRRDLNFVEDVVDALLRAGARPDGCAYNLGGKGNWTLLEVAELLIKLAGKGRYRMVPFPSELGRIDIGSCYSDYSRASAVLGWEPRVPLEDGLRRTFEFYRKNMEFYL